jgi:alpha-D-ribose 1-methylphosphonate 5-triphosphate synthase subunit PhnL
MMPRDDLEVISRTPAVAVRDVSKSFVMHLRGGTILPVVAGLTFDLFDHECVALCGPSGAGKSTVLRMIYANYRCEHGQILIRSEDTTTDVTRAEPRVIRLLRRRTIGYVSQFLRTIPRVSTFSIVSAAGREAGCSADESDARAAELLCRLGIPQRLWILPPGTFSGGEQQRVNIARGLIGRHAILLLDEPTSSLDAANRETVVALISEAKFRGAAILGIFHDQDVRDRVADRVLDISQFAATAHAATSP